MRQKFLYLSFIFIMILLLVLVNKKPKVIQPVLEGKNQQQVLDNESASLLGDNQSSSLSSSKVGVTLIRKTIPKGAPDELLLPAQRQKPENEASAQSGASSGTSGLVSSKTTDSTAKAESPGITKISKRPTAERKQQLKDNGVLMF
ncbi:MAG: hypothetical protein WC412_04700 [Candidatus Omnitrophota bacterium]|jgi:hypothetical protein